MWNFFMQIQGGCRWIMPPLGIQVLQTNQTLTPENKFFAP